MAKFTIQVINSEGNVLMEKTNENRLVAVYKEAYNEGDKIVLKCSEKNVFALIQLDDAMNEEFVYFTSGEMAFDIPFGEKKYPYSPKSFTGEKHVISARLATETEIKNEKNLARNCYDQHAEVGLYPHAHANVETRGESVFAAKNAINGNTANEGHGIWPYESWGINMQDDAEITLEFGREVLINRIVLVTRADFPHDNYWQHVTFTFSDGTEYVFDMEKSYEPHECVLPEKKKVSWIKLGKLIKDPEDPSPFPALTQFEVYGVEA